METFKDYSVIDWTPEQIEDIKVLLAQIEAEDEDE